MSDTPAPATTTIKLIPPGETEPQDIEINLLGFTLAERNLAKKLIAQFTDPDIVELVAVNAFVVWRRTHPEARMEDWVNGITFGDMVGTSFATVAEQPWFTPEGYDPESSGTG
jgi:hypothetical protein